jgi:plastocyanin
MKHGIATLVFVILVWGTSPAMGDGSATTQPSTRATGNSIRGHVGISATWELRKPDLAHVVVYLASDPVLDAIPPDAKSAEMDQRDKAFVPKFLVVPRTTSVEFPNWDHFDHNVFSRSKAAPAFDLDRYAYGMSKSREFENAGVIQVFCNVHPDMRAIIFVTPNPLFSRVDDDGQFEIPNVPSGKYDVVVWSDRCNEQHQSVSVDSIASASLTFTLEEDRQSIFTNDPPRPSSYGTERGLNVKRERLNLPVVPDAHPAPQPLPANSK